MIEKPRILTIALKIDTLSKTSQLYCYVKRSISAQFNVVSSMIATSVSLAQLHKRAYKIINACNTQTFTKCVWSRITAKVVKEKTLEENTDLKHPALMKFHDGQTEKTYHIPGEQKKEKSVGKL